ncbi:MAG: hypothetical protein GY903_21365 [Fuerstiella sp.]|nr:hypothetical protein [Fuerstiella sp.]MCP4857041.1 hypothetical protein [Fuerstiella sp.]
MVTIGDHVWDDANRNGIQDIGEPGIGDVTVNLLDANLQQFQTITTNPAGFYAFTVPPGQYAIEVQPPSGFTGFSPKDAGGNSRDQFDSDADPASGRTDLFTATSTSPQDTIDVGMINDRPIIDNPDSSTRDPNPELTWTPIIDVVTYDVETVNLTADGGPDTVAIVDSFFRPTSDLAMGRHQFRVRGTYGDGRQTDWSEPVFIDVRPQTELNVDRDYSNGFPDINWTPVSGAVRYEIWVYNRTTGIQQVVRDEFIIDSFFRPTDELPIGWYNFWVRPYGQNNYAGTWTGRSFRIATPARITSPVAAQVDGLPTFTWDAVAGAETYDLWVRQVSPEQTDQVIRRQDLTGTSFTPVTPLPAGSFVFWVQPQGVTNFQSSWGDIVQFQTFANPVVQGPDSQTATITSDITWTAVHGSSGYDLEVRDAGNTVVISETNLQTTLFAPATPFAWGSEFFVRVRALDGSGSPGPWSPSRRFVTPPNRVTLVGPGNNVPAGPIRFSWNAVNGGAAYELWVNQYGGPIRIVHERFLTTSEFTSTLPAGNYRFWVRAINSEGRQGEWSFGRNVTVTINTEQTDSASAVQLTSVRRSTKQQLIDLHTPSKEDDVATAVQLRHDGQLTADDAEHVDGAHAHFDRIRRDRALHASQVLRKIAAAREIDDLFAEPDLLELNL